MLREGLSEDDFVGEEIGGLARGGMPRGERTGVGDDDADCANARLRQCVGGQFNDIVLQAHARFARVHVEVPVGDERPLLSIDGGVDFDLCGGEYPVEGVLHEAHGDCVNA